MDDVTPLLLDVLKQDVISLFVDNSLSMCTTHSSLVFNFSFLQLKTLFYQLYEKFWRLS